MIQNVLRHMIGIGQNGLVSLCLFVLVFTGVIIWACLQKEKHLNLMAHLPLEADAETPNPTNDAHE
jgi:hypothetical protein